MEIEEREKEGRKKGKTREFKRQIKDTKKKRIGRKEGWKERGSVIGRMIDMGKKRKKERGPDCLFLTQYDLTSFQAS